MDCIRLGGVGITNTLTAQVINEGVHIRNPDERDESREADDGAAGRPSFAQPRLPSRKPSQPDEASPFPLSTFLLRGLDQPAS
jgi:hypothetical protein